MVRLLLPARHDNHIRNHPGGMNVMGIKISTLHRNVLAALCLSAISGTALAALPGPIVSPHWLKAHLHDKRLVILDLRSPKAYAAGHIPGAISAPYVHWRMMIRGVNRMLPPIPVIQAYLRSVGVNNNSEVVVYNDLATPMGLGLGGETRAFWTLKVLGHNSEALLNGGFEGWLKSHGALTKTVRHAHGNLTAHFQPQIYATLQQVRADLHTHVVLVDNRPMHQIVGLTKAPFVARYGHIPGAVPYPVTWMVGHNGNLLPKAKLEALARVAGFPENHGAPMVTYCNTGHWASIGWFVATQELGYKNVRLYDGSMTQWAYHHRDPVSVGFVN
ncbi:sulfurtransferase [Acidiferrobacter thiooxydans]|uniref:Sulfurtransferase n=2 Tax=Acidiferrobacter thiooxydans TaxID=163359 RepID=A0A368HDC8_9GAMM|nr:sulfurtransferase [Acidiferrobacter thiooxydans]